MRTAPIFLATLAGLGSAFSIQRIPTPIDPQGSPYTLTGACIPRQGALIVATSDDSFLQSTDRGAHWAQVPAPTGPSGREIFGNQLTTSDGNQVWTGTQWQSVVYPAPYLLAQQTWMMSGTDWSPGIATAFQLSDSTYWAIRSTDSLRTWTEWLHFPLRNIPAGADRDMASYQDGSLWLPQKASARWQITSTGNSWRTVAWPDTSTEYLQRASGDTVVSVSGSTRDTTGRLRRTVDGGRTWSSFPLDQPGVFTLPLKSGHWLSRTYLPSGGKSVSALWASPTPNGPWTLLSNAKAGFLGQDGGLWYKDTTGIYLADLAGLASVHRISPAATGFELRPSGGGVVAVVDGIRPLRWTLAGPDGSVLTTGLARGAFEVPAVRGAAFLSIEGMGAKRIPPFLLL